jgi:hypothetical protein
MKKILLTLFALTIFTVSSGQNVAIGAWEAHYSYTSGKHVVDTGNRVFCSTYNGLFSLNPANNDIKVYSKSDGLHDVGISSMAYDVQKNALLLAYRSGNIDILTFNEASELEQVENLQILLNTPDLPENKKINRIIYHEGLAFLASNFGIVVLDTKNSEVREAYRYIGSGGKEVNVTDLTFTQDSLFAVTEEGLIGTSLSSAINRQYFASWKRIAAPANIRSVIARNNILYGGFAAQGILKREGTQWRTIASSASSSVSLTLSNEIIVGGYSDQMISIDASDNPLSHKNPLFTSISEAVRARTNVFWAADQHNGLVGNSENIFRTYSPAPGDTTITERPDSLVTDRDNLSWSILPISVGGGILIKDPKSNRQRILSTSPGNGSLPSGRVNGIISDNEGYIWFASERGVGYFIPDDVLSNRQIDAIFPIFGQRRLLSNEKCTSIVTEPGNRKWIGTTKGLYLFSPDGTELISHFTAANSSIPSDMITALRLEPDKGILFIDTPNGMVSYRSDASSAEPRYANVSVFPNPVRPGYTGNLGIKGLTNNCIVKITSLSGRLVYETRSQGGTASWNLHDYTGRRAQGGIYMIMSISEDKSAKFVGKFAIVE